MGSENLSVPKYHQYPSTTKCASLPIPPSAQEAFVINRGRASDNRNLIKYIGCVASGGELRHGWMLSTNSA